MPAVAPDTAAIVVVYRPDADPAPLIDRLRGSVGHTVLVDNAPAGHPALAALPPAPTLTRVANRNHGQLAGAYNRALALLQTRSPAPRWIVLLDEDSDAATLPALLADPAVQALLHDPTTAAVAPAYRDRATGLRGKHIRLRRWSLDYLPREFGGVEPVAFVINSMSVWRAEALQALGPFDETLGLDHIDTDLCLRARHAGLRVYLAGRHEFAHAIGERRRFRLFGREMQAGGHAPARRYLIGRNTTRLMRRELWREPAFALLCASRLAYESVGIVLAEPQHKLAKLAALWRGVAAGLFGGLFAPRPQAQPGPPAP